MIEVDVSAMNPERFRAVLSPGSFEAFQQGIRKARELLAGRVVWNVNSTARGGGVAELLGSLVAYARGAGIDVRWLVIEGDPDFFTVTKRIHNHLHGAPGDGGALDEEARAVYERVLADNMASLGETVRRGDVAIVHDPQPAGLIGALRASGVAVIWRCHIGLDRPNQLAREAWDFLHRYVAEADAYVFSRESFAWDGLDRDRIVVICPSIDVFSPKNEDLDPATVLAVLGVSGVVAGAADPAAACFERLDGTPGRVSRRAMMFETQPLQADTPVVVQVSRWDALKDPLGVIRGFAEHVSADTGSHLLYAGPATSAVADDPEGEHILREALAMRESLPEEPRSRVHLATLPMEDPAENAIIVNAMQRHAAVVTQKSLAEGFGLTVAEAMWKARPVVASRIGGIQSQIVDGDSGLLLDDPRDLEAFGAAVTGLLLDPAWAAQLGQRARERVREEFTSPRSLLDYLLLIEKILEPAGVSAAV
jgi:trehalose synthase